MRQRNYVPLIIVLGMLALASTQSAATATLKLSPSAGAPSSNITASGTGFGANESVQILFDSTNVGTATTSSSGAFTKVVQVPRTASPGAHTVQATGLTSGIKVSQTFTVRTDWPTFHINAQHTGLNRTENVLNSSNVSRLQLKWQGLMGDLVDFSSPAVVGGVAYIGSTDGLLYAFNADGCGASECSPLWTGATGDSIYSSPAVANGVVYVGSNSHELLAFKAAGCGASTCQPLWIGTIGGSILQSSPVVANGVVYVGSFDNKLYAFSASGCGASTCSPLWTAATGDHIESSPAVANGVV